MKSIIPLLAFPVLAAFLVVGCDQKTPGNSMAGQPTNSSMSDVNSISGGLTNAPATNSMPDTAPNLPASTNQ